MRVLIIGLIFIASNLFAQIESFDGFKYINGIRLYVKVIAQPFNKKTGKGEPLLIVHGGPGLNQSYFNPHFKKLAKWHTLIFYDQRACGKSSIPSPDSLSLKFFVEDIEGIRKEFNIEKLLILSHSWGAIPTIQYGLDHPDHVKGIVFCNPIALSQEFDSWSLEELKSRFTSRDSTNRSIIIGSPDFRAGKADAYRRLLLFGFQHSFSDNANFGKLKIELQPNYKEASAALNKGLSADLAGFNYYPLVQRLRFPTLILHGNDDILPLRASEKMLQEIPNSRLFIFRNSGHFVFIEESKKFFQEVVSFTRMIDQ